MIELRPYQAEIKAGVYAAWDAGATDVLAVAPTGSGKTVLFSDILRGHRGASVAIAHRQELVTQISQALARDGVWHRIIAPGDVTSRCVQNHMRELGRHWVSQSSKCAVAGVDTIIRRTDLEHWRQTVTLRVHDEDHHRLRGNKWGAVCEMFPRSRGLGVTATPLRSDGKGLGRAADGYIDTMVLGPGMRDLIDQCHLTEYRIFAPKSDLDLSSVKIASSGDYSPRPLAAAVHKSRIVGDVVSHYRRIADGLIGVTFAVDVAAAAEIAQAYNDAGVTAAVVSAQTPDGERATILRRLASGDIRQVVNVDLFGEGFDLPAIEVVSMARPTQSYGLFVQQFGRALRLKAGKERAIIIDHVGNVARHGLPDAPRIWTLDRADRKARGSADVQTTRTCPKCTALYERVLGMTCPYCGHVVEPSQRSAPEFVDGDLAELDAATLARLRGAIDAPPTYPYNAGPEIVGAINKRAREKAEAQETLRADIAQWAGYFNEDVPTLQRRFFITFGIDVLSAQALGRKDAEELRDGIRSQLTLHR